MTPWISRRHATLAGPLVVSVDFLTAAATVARPLMVTAGVITAAATWGAPTPGQPVGDSISNVFNNVSADNGPVGIAVAGLGQSRCSMLVQPCARFATIASPVAGNTGPCSSPVPTP
ncbi:MAG TPA: hypothetical protein VKI00_22685 [Mycobacterium sp.]|uniref:hypothetical protein n=1 Tax=Mycobacterium sp. TaxID=1785 RepID=UPI002BEBB04C|nr:hypothetical protein [Mycobacterium sp.]HME78351.1 hypothetical protein [Mycobacterium sp.]